MLIQKQHLVRHIVLKFVALFELHYRYKTKKGRKYSNRAQFVIYILKNITWKRCTWPQCRSHFTSSRFRPVITDCIRVGYWRILEWHNFDTMFRENHSIQTKKSTPSPPPPSSLPPPPPPPPTPPPRRHRRHHHHHHLHFSPVCEGKYAITHTYSMLDSP